MDKERGKFWTALICVLFGVFGLIKVIQEAELAIKFLSLTFGIVAIIWAKRAKASLSPGTLLKDYTSYFMNALILIVSFLVWDTMSTLFYWEGAIVFPQYLFLTSSFLVFVFASYKILSVGRVFGFQPQIKQMKKALKRKTNKE